MESIYFVCGICYAFFSPFSPRCIKAESSFLFIQLGFNSGFYLHPFLKMTRHLAFEGRQGDELWKRGKTRPPINYSFC